MACTAKHTKYQPTDDEWICPACGAKGGDFCVSDPDGASDPDCPLLHEGDELGCYGVGGGGCNWAGTSGKAFAAKVQRAKNLVPCSYCKGSGLVPGAPKGGSRG